MKTTHSYKRTYVSPKAKFVQLNLQRILASSGNPSITNPSMPWEGNEDPSISNPTMPWGTQKKTAPWGQGDAE